MDPRPHHARGPAGRLEAFACSAEGQTYADLPERLRRYRSDIFTDKYKRLAWDELSRTITAHIAKDGYWYIHPEQHRTLSIREAARVQTFPDWFRFAGQPSPSLQADRQRGPARLPQSCRYGALPRALNAGRRTRKAADGDARGDCWTGTPGSQPTRGADRAVARGWCSPPSSALERSASLATADSHPFERGSPRHPPPLMLDEPERRLRASASASTAARLADRGRARPCSSSSTARSPTRIWSCVPSRASATRSRRQCSASVTGRSQSRSTRPRHESRPASLAASIHDAGSCVGPPPARRSAGPDAEFKPPSCSSGPAICRAGATHVCG